MLHFGPQCPVSKILRDLGTRMRDSKTKGLKYVREKEGGVWEQILINCSPHLISISSTPPTHFYFLPISFSFSPFPNQSKERRREGKRGKIRITLSSSSSPIYLCSSSNPPHSHSLGDIEEIGATKSKGGEVEDLEELGLDSPIGEIEGQDSKVTPKPIQFEIVKWMRKKCVMYV